MEKLDEVETIELDDGGPNQVSRHFKILQTIFICFEILFSCICM